MVEKGLESDILVGNPDLMKNAIDIFFLSYFVLLLRAAE